MVRMLISDFKADINTVDRHNDTPLHDAALLFLNIGSFLTLEPVHVAFLDNKCFLINDQICKCIE